MLYCKKYAENKNPRVVSTNKGRVMLLLKCATCDSKNLLFIKKQDASGLLSNLWLKTLLSKTTLLGDILF